MKSLRKLGVYLLGRDRVNGIISPYYDWLARRRARVFLRTLQQKDLLVHLGCGPRVLPGWINVDRARGPKVDVVWDLCEGLPFESSSCSAIFSEHVIEHVSKEDAEALLRECHRVLKPGGVVRLSTPDAGRYLRSYVGDGSFLRSPKFERQVDTAMDRINEMMRENGLHLWAYDAESLLALLRRAGFPHCQETSFGMSLHSKMSGIDQKEREFESLYAEGQK